MLIYQKNHKEFKARSSKSKRNLFKVRSYKMERPASDMAADEWGKVNTANKKNRA